MSEEKQAAHTECESLRVVREKFASLIEIYSPRSAARENALTVFGATLTEFEAAVREDERIRCSPQPSSEENTGVQHEQTKASRVKK